MKRHQLTPKQQEEMRKVVSEMERILSEHPGIVRFWSSCRCGHCKTCFCRGIVDALAVEVGEG